MHRSCVKTHMYVSLILIKTKYCGYSFYWIIKANALVFQFNIFIQTAYI